jgi:hypothetical protein
MKMLTYQLNDTEYTLDVLSSLVFLANDESERAYRVRAFMEIADKQIKKLSSTRQITGIVKLGAVGQADLAQVAP